MPVVIVVWGYPGLSAIDMERRVVIISERAIRRPSTISSTWSRSRSPAPASSGCISIRARRRPRASRRWRRCRNRCSGFFRPESLRRISSITTRLTCRSRSSMFQRHALRAAVVRLRSELHPRRLFSIEGLSAPSPFGGRSRVDHGEPQPEQMYANGLSAQDVGNALSEHQRHYSGGLGQDRQSRISGRTNGSPNHVAKFNHLPVKVVNGTPIFLGDVAPVTIPIRCRPMSCASNGKRGTYIPMFKHAAASTLSVVITVKSDDSADSRDRAQGPEAERSRSTSRSSCAARYGAWCARR